MTGAAFEPSSLFSHLDEEWQAIVAVATAEFDRQFDAMQSASLEEALSRFDNLYPEAPESVRQALVADLLSIEAHRRFGQKSGFLPSFAQLISVHQSLAKLIKAVYPFMSPCDRLPEQIGEYFPQEQIDRGGQANIVTATKPDMRGKVVVIKYAPLTSAHAGLILLEGSILEQLSATRHPNIMGHRHYGNDGTHAFLVLPYLDGETLQDAGRLNPERIIDIGYQLADALAVVHSCQCLHNDITPANVRLTPTPDSEVPQPVLMDFGLAIRQQAGNWPKPKARSPGGTTGFESPEQLSPDRMVDERSDIFQLGVTLGWALTGRDARDPVAFADAVRQPEIPAALRDCLLTATAPNPEDRFHSAREMSECLAAQLPKPGIPTKSLRTILPIVAWTAVGLAATFWLFMTIFPNSRPMQDEQPDGTAIESKRTEEGPASSVADAAPTMSLPDANRVLEQLQETRDGSNKGQQIAIPALISQGCDFVKSDLSGVSFANTDLSNGDFTEARLQVCDFEKAVAENATFTSLRLDASSLAGCQFSHCDLSRTRGLLLDAADSQFIDCHLLRTNLAFSNLQGADFTGANLSGACLSFCNLTGATFRGADLTGAYINGSVLCGADFTDAIVSDTSFYATVIDDNHVLTVEQLGGAVLRLPSPGPSIEITEFWASSEYDSGQKYTDGTMQYLSLPETDQAPGLPVYEHPHELPVGYVTDRYNLHLSRNVLSCGNRRWDIDERIERNQKFLESQYRTDAFVEGDGSWQSRCLQKIDEAAPRPDGSPAVDVQLLVLAALKEGIEETQIGWQQYMTACRDDETSRTPRQFFGNPTIDDCFWQPLFPARLLSPLPEATLDLFRQSIQRRIPTVPNDVTVRLPIRLLKKEAMAVFVGDRDDRARFQREDVMRRIGKDGFGYLDPDPTAERTSQSYVNTATPDYENVDRVVLLSLEFPGAGGQQPVFLVFPQSFGQYCLRMEPPVNDRWCEAELTFSITGFKVLEGYCVIEVVPDQVQVLADGAPLATGPVTLRESSDAP